MTDDDLIKRATEALADHVLGALWVCVCGAECWQADAGAGGACVIASNGYHREHQARAVLDAIDLPGLLAASEAKALREAADEFERTRIAERVIYIAALDSKVDNGVQSGPARWLQDRADRIDPDTKEQDRG